MTQQETPPQGETRSEDGFVPRGAVAFMVVLILVYAAVWFYFYLMLTNRP